MTEQVFGYPTFGYWEFFNSDEGAEICNGNVRSALDNDPSVKANDSLQKDSLTSLFYPHDPELLRTHLAPRGAARAWVTANTIKPRPKWLSESEVIIHNGILAKGGYVGPLSWYIFTSYTPPCFPLTMIQV